MISSRGALARRLQYAWAETNMNPAGNIDVLELPHGPGALDGDGEGRASQTPAARERSSARWWFAFDGWRTAEVDAEFVLA